MNELLPISVIYAEDEPDLRDALGTYLGYVCTRLILAKDGREALEAFHREKPDLVVTDIRMPGLDGLELVRAVRKKCPEIPVILT